jgi:hypothetical protein
VAVVLPDSSAEAVVDAAAEPRTAALAALRDAAESPDLLPLCDGDPHVWRDAALVRAVTVSVDAGDDAMVSALGLAYGSLLLTVPVLRSGRVALVGTGIAERRRRGAFSTPPALAAALAAHALIGSTSSGEALLGDAVPGDAVPGDGSTTMAAPCAPAPSVVDPACGSGALLLAAFERLLALGVPASDAWDGLHGVDADPAAVAVCRAALAARARAAGLDRRPEDLADRVVVGDALLGPTPTCPGEGLVWHRTFPGILDREGAEPEPVTGWRGGFDAVLANPPWERLKVIGKDWSGVPPPHLRASRAAGARSLRDAGRHPLTGAGELNAYLPFVETCWRLLAPSGRAAVVVPAGIASDRSSSALLQALLDTGALEHLHLLDPPAPLFDGVSRRVGVAVVVIGAGPHVVRQGRTAQVGVGIKDAAEVGPHEVWPLDAATLRLVNPNSGTAPLFGTVRDAAVVTAAHRRWPVLKRRAGDGTLIDDPWQLRLVTPFHMTRDARFFATAPGPDLWPLWEAKHAGLLDHLGGGTSAHRYWVEQERVRDRFGDLVARGWLAGYRNVTTTDASRTLVPTALPVAGVGNSLPLLAAPRLPLLLAALASMPVDHLVRQKHAGANLNFFKVEQLPLPPPSAYDVPAPWCPGRTIGGWVLDRFAVAVRWDRSLAPLATELAAEGVVVDPARLAVASGDLDADRARALAELDAGHAVLLGLDRPDLEHVLATFEALRRKEEKLVGRFVTAERVLHAYDTLRAAL